MIKIAKYNLRGPFVFLCLLTITLMAQAELGNFNEQHTAVEAKINEDIKDSGYACNLQRKGRFHYVDDLLVYPNIEVSCKKPKANTPVPAEDIIGTPVISATTLDGHTFKITSSEAAALYVVRFVDAGHAPPDATSMINYVLAGVPQAKRILLRKGVETEVTIEVESNFVEFEYHFIVGYGVDYGTYSAPLTVKARTFTRRADGTVATAAGGPGNIPWVDVTYPPIMRLNKLTVTWSPPKTRRNKAVLFLDEISGYDLRMVSMYGDTVVRIGNVTRYVFEADPDAQYQIRAIDQNNTPGAWSKPFSGSGNSA